MCKIAMAVMGHHRAGRGRVNRILPIRFTAQSQMFFKMAAQATIDLFHVALNYGLQSLGFANISLKEKQYEVLRELLAVLPTGYGKSLIYQLLPPVLNFMEGSSAKKFSVMVISPLNALIHDQIVKIREAGLNVCMLKGDRVTGDDDEEDVSLTVPVETLLTTSYDLIFAHPEVVIDSRKVAKLLKNPAFKRKVRVIVVDEAHLVIDWKDFRPAYSKLGSLASMFPDTPLLGLTATATKATQKKIEESLGMINATEILISPNRSNIYLSSSRRGNRGDELGTILDPLVQDLRAKRMEFPLTIVYGSLETISCCYLYFSCNLGSEQYEPLGAENLARNRLFSQFHAQYPEHERQRIVDGLVQGNSKIRVIFATVAFGIGIDIPNIRQIVHIGVPYTMEEYFQEAGRAGRDGLPAKAHVYYNSYDISKGKTHLSQVMRDYVQKQECKRKMILGYFGFQVPTVSSPLHQCCDYHKKICDCDDCLVASISTMFEETIQNPEDQTDASAETSPKQLEPHAEEQLREELSLFRLSLPGSGRSSVGGTSLSSGITISLIDDNVKNIFLLTSLEEIEARLPIYSNSHAIAVWNIIQKYINP